MLSATELCELLKVDVLLAHYEETQKHDGPTSFFHFLVMHYVTDDNNQKDNDRDQQLPFKSQHNIVASNTFTLTLNATETAVASSAVPIKTVFSNYNDPFLSVDFSSSIWNPPRIS